MKVYIFVIALNSISRTASELTDYSELPTPLKMYFQHPCPFWISISSE